MAKSKSRAKPKSKPKPKPKATAKLAAAKKAKGKAANKPAAAKARGKQAARGDARFGWRSEFIVGFKPSLLHRAGLGRNGHQPRANVVDVMIQVLKPLLNAFGGNMSDPHICDNLPRDVSPLIFVVVRFRNPNTSLGALRATIAADPEQYATVKYIERQAVIATCDLPWSGVNSQDPYARFQWALKKIGADQVWNVPPPPNANPTIVAIVDSGLRRPDGSLPEDIDPNTVLPAAQCQPTSLPFDNIDEYGHGTMLAGTIAGVTGDGLGIASPLPDPVHNNWGIQLMPIKFFGPLGAPVVTDAVKAICHAIHQPYVKVINASWHLNVARGSSQCLLDAITAANAAGILFVAAAGNDGVNNQVFPTYPANYGNKGFDKNLKVLTVAASTWDDSKAWFSNYSSSFVDIAAPGMHMVTTGNYFTNPPPPPQPPARYPWYNGTSPAAALCSCAAALVYARNPGWSPDNIQQYLKDSADNIPLLRRVCQGNAPGGGNRLNIANAILPLAVTAPQAGDVVHVGQNYDVTWRRKFQSPLLNGATLSFTFEYSNDNGASWNSRPINGQARIGDRSFPWTPGIPAGMARLRLTTAPANFTITSGVFQVV